MRKLIPAFWLALAAFIVAGLTRWAVATPPSLITFKQIYAPRAESDLAKANCLICHSKMPPSKDALNPYGRDVQKAAPSKLIDAKVLRAVEKLDSDKDGVRNIDEIKGGKLPGDPKSKPKK